MDACQNENISKVSQLLTSPDIDVNFQDLFGRTAFFWACAQSNIEIVKMMLNHENVNINQPDKTHTTPLMALCYWGEIEIVERILVSGKEINLNATDRYGEKAIDRAKKYPNEHEGKCDQRKTGCPKIVHLLESFQNDPEKTRIELEKKLGSTIFFFFFFFFN